MTVISLSGCLRMRPRHFRPSVEAYMRTRLTLNNFNIRAARCYSVLCLLVNSVVARHNGTAAQRHTLTPGTGASLAPMSGHAEPDVGTVGADPGNGSNHHSHTRLGFKMKYHPRGADAPCLHFGKRKKKSPLNVFLGGRSSRQKQFTLSCSLEKLDLSFLFFGCQPVQLSLIGCGRL